MARSKPSSTQEQLALFPKRGGKRRGAGRPPKGLRAGSSHKTRPFLHARNPVHVTLRAINAVGNLRRRCVYKAIREATLTTARREDFRICHLSIQHNHVHMLVEASDKYALASGMKQRGSDCADVDVESRLVLYRDLVSGLGRVQR